MCRKYKQKAVVHTFNTVLVVCQYKKSDIITLQNLISVVKQRALKSS